MVTSLTTGDKIHVGDSVTLTLVAIEGNLVCFEVESSTQGGHGVQVFIEGNPESDCNRWESNIVGRQADDVQRAIQVILESDEFDEVFEGDPIPELETE